MVIPLLVAAGLPLIVGSALMASDRLARPLRYLGAWMLALLTSLGALAGVLVSALAGSEVNLDWVPQIGLRWHLLLDGISGPLATMAAAVTVLAIAVSSRQRPQGTAGLFFGSILVTLGGAILAFAARDAVAFFVAFEVVLVPMWVLIDRYGQGEGRRSAAWAFALFTVTGSMFMLAGILMVAIQAGTSDLDALTQRASALPANTQLAAAALMTFGLAIKVPLLGVHSWLPRAHTAAPTAGSMILAAVLLKLGTYGFVRLVVLPMPDAWSVISPIVAVLAVAGIVWGALVCLTEPDLKRLIAFSSVAHMGFVMFALASGSHLGLQAALYGNLAHGVISALLFAIVGALKAREGNVTLTETRVGLRVRQPSLGWWFVVGCAAALGLPGLAGFWGEALAIFAAFDVSGGRSDRLFQVLAVIAALGGVLAAAYCLRMLRIVWAGESAAPSKDIEQAAARLGQRVHHGGDIGDGLGSAADATPSTVRGVELWAIAVLGIAVIVLGLTPSLVMELPNDVLVRALGALK